MDIITMYNNQKDNFRKIFNHITVLPEYDRFAKRMSRYSGINQTTIFLLPGLYDYDPLLLKTSKDIEARLMSMANYPNQIPDKYFKAEIKDIQDEFHPDVISSITSNKKIIKVKDITRLSNVMSSSMPGTLGNPEKLKIKLAPEVKQFFTKQLNIIKDTFSVEGGIKANETIHKRKDSSCGAFFGSNSHVFFQALVKNFIYRCINDKEQLQSDLRSLSKLLTQPLTRRMPKSMKPYSDYDTSMTFKEFNREVDIDIIDRSRQIAKKYGMRDLDVIYEGLGGPKHRFVNNVSEIERMMQILNAAVIANHKSRMNTAFIFNEEAINRVLMAMSTFNKKLKDGNGYLYSVLAMDVSGFDKSTNEEMMTEMSKHLDSFGNHQMNYIVRTKSDLFFPHDDQLVSFTDFANKLTNSNEITMIGLNSGLTWVTFAGKTANTIMSYYIVNRVIRNMLINPALADQWSVVNYCDGSLCIPKESLKEEYNKHDLNIFCYNTGDDMIVNSNIFFLDLFIKEYEKLIQLSEKEGVMYAYKQEFDNEYLSKFVVYNEDEQLLTLGPNIVRRVASLLKPEHSVLREGKEREDINWKDILSGVQIPEGIYRNIVISYASKIIDFDKYPEVLNVVNDCFKDNFGYTLEELTNELSLSINIIDDINDSVYQKLDLSTAEKLLIDNPEIAYYKVDMRLIDPNIIDQLFVNVTPEEYIPALKSLGYNIRQYKDIPTSIIEDLKEEELRWRNLERRINAA